jgi:hypothetical protein
MESKEGKGTGNRYDLIGLVEKGGIDEGQGGSSQVRGVSREGLIVLSPLKVLDIGRDQRGREIVHALIEASVKSDFHTLGLEIKP